MHSWKAEDILLQSNLQHYITRAENERATVGLPEDDTARHKVVKEKLLDLLLGSLRFVFGDQYQPDSGESFRSTLEALAKACFTACIAMDEPDFLFDELYDWYSDAAMTDIFLYALEPYVIEGKISLIPPSILQDLVLWYSGNSLYSRLEEMICSLNPATMDIEQVTAVCRDHRLFDGLIYVYNLALEDFVSPID